MTVIGIGGLFFRSRDPQARAQWYRTHLGIAAGAEGESALWTQEAGPTVFAPFSLDTDQFPAEQPFMLNFRVTGLTELVQQMTAAGITVEARPEWDTEFGRLVRLQDPEGLPIELWESAEL